MQKINVKRAFSGAFITLVIVCLVYMAVAIIVKGNHDKLTEAENRSKAAPLKQQLNTDKNKGVPLGITEDADSMTAAYDPDVSSTYKRPYAQLKNELLYARLACSERNQQPQIVNTIRDKAQLIEIVREFDKLKAIAPQQYDANEFDSHNIKFFTLVLWREGRSVSYVFNQNGSNYYEGSTAMRAKNGRVVLRKMPETLVRLIISRSAR
ncbi:MAG TPA: hypothetical protein VGK02_06070 [Candidatus Aquicultor sp.]|jgi:hypothetical protein